MVIYIDSPGVPGQSVLYAYALRAKRVINNRDRFAFGSLLGEAGRARAIHRSSLIILTFTRLAATSARLPSFSRSLFYISM